MVSAFQSDATCSCAKWTDTFRVLLLTMELKKKVLSMSKDRPHWWAARTATETIILSNMYHRFWTLGGRKFLTLFLSKYFFVLLSSFETIKIQRIELVWLKQNYIDLPPDKCVNNQKRNYMGCFCFLPISKTHTGKWLE